MVTSVFYIASSSRERFVLTPRLLCTLVRLIGRLFWVATFIAYEAIETAIANYVRAIVLSEGNGTFRVILRIVVFVGLSGGTVVEYFGRTNAVANRRRYVMVCHTYRVTGRVANDGSI